MKRSVYCDSWVRFLEENGFEAVHWSTTGDPTATDAVVMAWGAIAASSWSPTTSTSPLCSRPPRPGPSVIQVRTQDVLPDAVGAHVVRVLRDHRAALDQSAIISIDELTSRVRVLPVAHSTRGSVSKSPSRVRGDPSPDESVNGFEMIVGRQELGSGLDRVRRDPHVVVGMGRPLRRRSAAIREHRSAVVSDTATKETCRLSRKAVNSSMFFLKRVPRRNPRKSSAATTADSTIASVFLTRSTTSGCPRISAE